MKDFPDLVIKDFQNGIANSPHLGFADMRNLDIHTIPGIAQINFQTAKESSTTITGLVKWIVRDPNTSKIYALDDGNKVYKSTDAGDTWSDVTGSRTVTSGHGNGLGIWKDYLFAVRDTAIDVMKISDDSWTNSWQTTLTSDSLFHPVLAGQDDILYIGHGRYLASVAEVAAATFAPGTGATYTFTLKALTLPQNYKVKCLAELGKNIMVGTWQGANLFDLKTADIFPWDRSSTSFNLPIKIAENGVNQLLTYNNKLYIHAGTRGRIYISNGVTIEELRRPDNMTFAYGEWLNPYPGAICFHNGKVLIGYSNGGGNTTPIGVYSIRGATLVLDNIISTGNIGASNTLEIGALLSTANDYFLISWKDAAASAQGMDSVGFSGYRYTSYAAYADSALFEVASPLSRRTFSQIDINLAKPLATGQGVRLSYRANLTDNFTAIGTYDFATYAAVQNLNVPCSITSVTHLQIRLELTTGSSSGTTPQLRELRFR